MKKKLFTAFALLQMVSCSTVWAQTETKEIELDPVTVTSSLIEKRSSETGRSISIIKGEIFASLPVHSIDELLRYVPGIEIQARGPQGSQSDISMRGGTFQQVLVILDGIRLNDPNTGHFSAYIPLAPAEIDRIEVLKGASSALYGSDAVGGVINIITKAFNAKKHLQARQISGQISAGEYGLVNTNIGGFMTTGKVAVSAGVLANHATGRQQRGIQGFFHNNSVSLGLHYMLNSHWNISYRSAHDYRHFAAQNFYTASALDTATEKIASWWHQTKISYEKNNSAVTLDAGYKKLQDHFVFFPTFTPNDNKSTLIQALLTLRQKLGENTSLVSGVNFNNRQIASNDRGHHHLRTAAPFVSAVQKIGNVFTLIPSLRMEFIGNIPAEWVPNLTASYKLKTVQLRASGGKTIRDADFTERYNNYGKQTVGKGNRIGNPWLIMEKSWGYETGFDWFLPASMKISSTFFQRFNTDLIDWISTAYADMPRKDNLVAGANYLLAKNISVLNTTGWEADIQVAPHLSRNQSLVVNAGMLWQYSKSSEQAASFYISSHARFITNLYVQYVAGPFSISITSLYKSRQPQSAGSIVAPVSKDYFLLNGKSSYSFFNNTLAAFIQVDNVFNRTYSDLLGAKMPGRWLQAGIGFNLRK